MKILILCFLLPSAAFGYFETLNTADIVQNGTLRVLASPQLGISRHKGLNLNGLADLGLGENSDMRFAFGLGKVDFSFGGFYKWAPIPDTEDQPGMGLITGVTYANIDGSNEFSVVVTPLISESWESKYGLFKPYAGVPIGVMSRSGDTATPIQLSLGTEFRPVGSKWKNTTYMAELNLNLTDSFSSISLAAVFYFEDFSLIKIRKNR